MPRDAVSRTANVGTVGKNGLIVPRRGVRLLLLLLPAIPARLPRAPADIAAGEGGGPPLRVYPLLPLPSPRSDREDAATPTGWLFAFFIFIQKYIFFWLQYYYGALHLKKILSVLDPQ